MREALSIKITGIVQGVGFRPFVYRCAHERGVTGWVLNAVDGVTVHAEAEPDDMDAFIVDLSEHAPAAAQVQTIEMDEVPCEGFADFEIRFSDAAEAEQTTLISPDLATCDACVRELFDPDNRRFRYPFINCTDCGPRFTILRDLPYDRPNTSMASFEMCDACSTEYTNPADRRFHAQPDACFDCGPHISLVTLSDEGETDAPRWGNTRQESDALLAEAVELLKSGGILAVKGLGGFHLACDADNEEAVARLRLRKRREGKALACMVANLDAVGERCFVSDAEARVLVSPARPIVLLRTRPDARLVSGLAPATPELGMMLPATPLQHLLLHDFGGMLVMTSGNVHEEPICIDDDEAVARLRGIADAVLGNDRAILARYDDSVVRVLQLGEEQTSIQAIRRARGFAPRALALPSSLAEAAGKTSVFATGPEQKNTFCLTNGDNAFVSQHIGDMENAETFDAWLEADEMYRRLYRIEPQLLAYDLHPEYLTSKWAEQRIGDAARGEASFTAACKVQHHHAHVVSALAENDVEGPALGLAFDGTGYGEDGAIWGGEALLVNLADFERFANFAYVPMPGGAAAVKHPLRMAYGALWAFDLLEHPAAAAALEPLGEVADLCAQMIDKGLNTPQTSSVGRLFDAASALMGICIQPTYEGAGAVALEAAIGATPALGFDERYAFELSKNVATDTSTARDTSVLLIDAAPVFAALLDDLAAAVEVGIIARRFHDAFVRLILDLARLADAVYGIRTVALSGGVFMNRYLTEHALVLLEEQGFTAVINRELPPNDACISYGQAVVALAANNKRNG